MAEPSKSRNFFGRVVDRILPGSNYNPTTGQYSNVGKGIAGLGARLAATAFAGPAVGALVGKGAGYLIDHTGNQIGGVQPEGVAGYSPVSPGYANAITLPSAANLGLGAQTPGNSWQGYMQGAGSANNFGNQQFGNGMSAQPGVFNPYSQWGQQITAPSVSQGSLGGFGNNVGGFTGATGGGRTGGSYTGGAVQSAGMFGGNLVNESMLDLQRRWSGRPIVGSPIKQGDPQTSQN